MTRDDVLAALGTVYDPELDEPITALRFVASCEVADDGAVDVRLRLPTPQCAPNFAFLMAADARDAVRAATGPGHEVRVVLVDHYTGAEINAAVASGGGFGAAFPGEVDGELDALRALFRRKALVARQGRLLETVGDPASARLGDLAGPDEERCRELRAELGIDASDGAPAFVRGDGTPVPASELARFERVASLTALSLDANGGMCRSLLQVRYGKEEEEVAA